MRRREFIAGLGGAAAWPLGAQAQQGERVRRIHETKFKPSNPDKLSAEIEAKIAIAGPLAEKLALPDSIEHYSVAHHADRCDAIRAAIYLACHEADITPPQTFDRLPTALAESAQRILDRLMAETDELERENWPAIWRIAERLLSVEWMGQDELDRLIWPAQRIAEISTPTLRRAGAATNPAA